MGKTLREKLAGLPEPRQSKIKAEAQELITEEMSLRELRKGLALTQKRLAEKMGIGQDEVSRAERRADMLISTVRNYVTAMGGELDIVARLPGHPDIHLTHLGDLLEDEEEVPTCA